jgi:hypothetical protein
LTRFRKKLKGFDSATLLKWLGVAGTAIASTWTIWSFFLKEMVLPSLTPSNINIEAQFKRLRPVQAATNTIDGPAKANNLYSSKAIPIQLKLRVTNLGVHSLKLENPIWMAYGVTLDKPITDPKTIQEAVGSQIANNLGYDKESPSLFRYSSYTELRKLMGIGTLLIGGDIKPGEVIESQRIILSPKDANYDYLQVKLWVPTLKSRSKEQELTKRIKVMVSTTGYPYYNPRIEFCSPGSRISRSLLQRIGFPHIDSQTKNGSSETTAELDKCKPKEALTPKEMNQLGAQFSKTEHEIMLNPDFSDDTK